MKQNVIQINDGITINKKHILANFNEKKNITRKSRCFTYLLINHHYIIDSC